MEERRTHAAPVDSRGNLHQLPALLLLDRLPIAMIYVDSFGAIVHANSVCADMLGYLDAETPSVRSLPKPLSGRSKSNAADCREVLRTATDAIQSNHT